MCCVFTCCGWMIDLAQRAWVFVMSCCISSAVCCALLMASMSGVALGYNYSLAEYIELKETNVSVFLKRGVFDDEVVADMDWRRGGGGQPSAERRAAEASESPVSVPDFPHGFRKSNDEGLFATTQINQPNELYGHDPDHNRFEGSLLKLTAMPAATAGTTIDREMAKVMTEYPPESMDQMKAIQGLLNRRKMLQNPSAVDGIKGFMSPNPIIVTMDYSAPINAFYSSTASDEANEMNVIKKLLNDRRMAAMKFDHMKQTIRPPPKPDLQGVLPEVFPDVMGGPARRMGGSGQLEPVVTDMAQYLQAGLQQLLNDPSKWYHPRAPTPAENPVFASPTLPKGPVTFSYRTTRRKLKIEDVTPLSQESFRRAMQEVPTDRHDNQKAVQNIIQEPEKDYDEEDVKGIPVRKKRKRRMRRDIFKSQVYKKTLNTSSYTDKVQLRTGTGLFSKLMTALINFKLLFAPEDIDSKVLREAASSEILPKDSSEISSINIVTSPYVVASSSQGMGVFKNY